MTRSGLEALFEEDKPLILVDTLPFSLGRKEEFEFLFGGNLPEFPAIAMVEGKKGWHVKLPSLWVINFNRFIEWAWNEIFIPNVDRVAFDIERTEDKIRKKYSDSVQFRTNITKMQMDFLKDSISSSIKSLEGTGYYTFFNQETEPKGVINELFHRVGSYGDFELINASLASFGAFISDLFNKKMSNLFEAGITKGKFYWKDRIFRYKVMRPILNKWFQTAAKQLSEEERTKAKAFVEPDLALIENNFDRGKLIDFIHYGLDLLDYPSYQIIKNEVINQVKVAQKGGKVNFDNIAALEAILEIAKRVKEGDIPYERGLDILMYDPRVVDPILDSMEVREILESKGLKEIDARILGYKNLSKTVKQRDFLVSVFKNINYANYLDKPSLSEEEREARQKLEEKIYNEQKFLDFTRDEILCRKIHASVWFTDTIESEAIRDKIGSDNLNNFLFLWILNETEEKDESYLAKHSAGYNGTIFGRSRGDDRSLYFSDILSNLLLADEFYRAFEKEKYPGYAEGMGIPEFGFSSGVCVGLITENATHLGDTPLKRANYLSNSIISIEDLENTINVKIGDEQRQLKGAMYNKGLLIGTDLTNKTWDAIQKLASQLYKIQTAIQTKRLSELKEELPKKTYEVLEKKLEENPNLSLVLKDCEEYLKSETEPIHNPKMLDAHIYKYLCDKYTDLRRIPKEDNQILIDSIRECCRKHKSYRSDLFGVRPFLVYIGVFNGYGKDRKHSEEKFGVWAYLNSKDQYDNIISMFGENCYRNFLVKKQKRDGGEEK